MAVGLKKSGLGLMKHKIQRKRERETQLDVIIVLVARSNSDSCQTGQCGKALEVKLFLLLMLLFGFCSFSLSFFKIDKETQREITTWSRVVAHRVKRT